MTIAVDLGRKATKQTKLLSEDANSVDTDEMQHYAAFHLGLRCLQMYSFRGFPRRCVT